MAEFTPLTRPSSPALDAILGKKFPVLDDGFIRVVDYMGNDGAIVQMARTSYGEGTKHVNEDRGLIRYLMRHYHTSPFESCELKLHVRVPMDTWRQWIRHRSACLVGDTILYFDAPSAESKGKRRRHNMTIADFHRLWYEGTTHPIAKKKPTFVEKVDPEHSYSVPELAQLVERRQEDLRNMIRAGHLFAIKTHQGGNKPSLFIKGKDWIEWASRTPMARVPMQGRLQRMKLRMCDELTGEIRHTTVTDIWESGVKPVYTVVLENGYRLTMSQDHRCLTENGWLSLAEATKLKLTADKTVTWDKSAPAFAVNGIPAHRDPEWLKQKRAEGLGITAIAEEAGVSYHTIRKSLEKFDLSFTEQEKARLRGLAQRGRKRNTKGPRNITPEGLERLRAARSGSASNFWKGGKSTERELIGRWTSDQAQRIHEKFDYKCAICSGKEKLHVHHVDPVWHNPGKAMDLDNLMTLCTPCHKKVHSSNLELHLLQLVENKTDLRSFWYHAPKSVKRHKDKKLPKPEKLVRTWARITRIEYAGEQPTYDLSVAGPFHNFVANGFVVHNSVNEYSTRYSVAIDSSQKTSPQEWRRQSAQNNQGSDGYIDPDIGGTLTEMEKELQSHARQVYEARLIAGVAREQARKDLPLSLYTEAYWKIDLHNLLHFLRLRMDSHAQKEIRDYATTIGEEIVAKWCPLVWEAFQDYRVNSLALTSIDQDILAALCAHGPQLAKEVAQRRGILTYDENGNPKRNRERTELEEKLRRLNLEIPW